MLFWIWISSGISVLRCGYILFCFGAGSQETFHLYGWRQPLGQAQDILSCFPSVTDLIHVTADQLNAPAAGRVIIVCLRLALVRGRRIKLGAAVAQLDNERTAVVLNGHLELFPR